MADGHYTASEKARTFDVGASVQMTKDWLARLDAPSRAKLQNRVGVVEGYRLGSRDPIVTFPKDGRRVACQLIDVPSSRLELVEAPLTGAVTHSLIASDIRDAKWRSNCAGEIFADDGSEKGVRIGHFQGDASLAAFVVAAHQEALALSKPKPVRPAKLK